MRRSLLFVLALLSSSQVSALDIEDFGTRGHTFSIQEKSLLKVIEERLEAAEKSGKLWGMQRQFQKKVKHSVSNPRPVSGLSRTEQERTFFFDPSIENKKDIKDHLGRLVIPKGAKANPLETLSWGDPFLFIDGSDEEQVNWAKTQVGKIILIKGKPLSLSKETGRWFYFDQGGALVRKLGIKQVPAKVSQEGLKLKIEEMKI